MKKISITFLLFLCTISYCQTGIIKGQIVDKLSASTLPGAAVELVNASSPQGTTTNLNGYFTLENIPIGRHVIKISFIGYETQTIPNIEVSTGKDVFLSIQLIENFNTLAEVVVTSSSNKLKARNKYTSISARQFGVKEVSRYAGGRSDVARLASNFAGVASPDDSRNDIVIRGNSPTGLLWKIEGIPLANPNHFSTLGTTGSPISALNPNLLKNSDFITSAFPAEYGNAMGGVFDLGFRKGNKDAYEYSFQMGAFSGIELNAEGPLNRKSDGSFLIAARYSLVGLTGGSGSSDTPNYADISFNIDLGKSKLGRFSLFGIIGNSSIDFYGKDHDKDNLFSAEDENSFVSSAVTFVGLKHEFRINNNSYIKTIIAGSQNKNTYKENRILNIHTNQPQELLYAKSDDKDARISLSTLYNLKVNNKLSFRTGVLVEQFSADLNRQERDEQPDNDNDGHPDLKTVRKIKGNYSIWQPFIQANYRLSQSISLNAGIHSIYSDLNNQFVMEPRVSMNWKLHPDHSLNFGYGIHHQNIATPLVFLNKEENGLTTQPNKKLNFARSAHYVLGYDVKLTPSWRGKIEGYYQDISNAAVDKLPTSYSSLTEGADFTFSSNKTGLINTGTGTNKGIEITLEKSFAKGYHALLTGSIFDSSYKGSDGIKRNTPFNNGHIFNFLAGKEFKIGKSNTNVFSIDGRFVTSGGKRYTPVDLEASKIKGYQIVNNNAAFSKQYDNYMRLDIKLGIRINSKKGKSSHKFYLDLQNITNRKNTFLKKYNRITNSINQIDQSGFFPDFGYRFQF